MCRAQASSQVVEWRERGQWEEERSAGGRPRWASKLCLGPIAVSAAEHV